MSKNIEPKWTVNYNIVSKENDCWVGTGWEFFDLESDAQKCYNRQIDLGNCPCKRPYYRKSDWSHLGAVHTDAIKLGKPLYKCPTCGSTGFEVSILGPDRCTFCDGTEGGSPPTKNDIKEWTDYKKKEREGEENVR